MRGVCSSSSSSSSSSRVTSESTHWVQLGLFVGKTERGERWWYLFSIELEGISKRFGPKVPSAAVGETG